MHQILLIKELFKELDFELAYTAMCVDNQACIEIAQESITSKRALNFLTSNINSLKMRLRKEWQNLRKLNVRTK